MLSDERLAGVPRGAERDCDAEMPAYGQLSDLGEPLDLLGQPVLRARQTGRGPTRPRPGPRRVSAARRIPPVLWSFWTGCLALLAVSAILCAQSWGHVLRALP